MPKNWCATQIEDNKIEYKISPAKILIDMQYFGLQGLCGNRLFVMGTIFGINTQAHKHAIILYLCYVLYYKEKRNSVTLIFHIAKCERVFRPQGI